MTQFFSSSKYEFYISLFHHTNKHIHALLQLAAKEKTIDKGKKTNNTYKENEQKCVSSITEAILIFPIKQDFIFLERP